MSAFDRCVPNPEMLARLLVELDTPMEYHEAMIETLDTVHREQFEREIESNPIVRDEWERFLFATQDDLTENF